MPYLFLILYFASFYLILTAYARRIFSSSIEVLAVLPPICILFTAVITSMLAFAVNTSTAASVASIIVILAGAKSVSDIRTKKIPLWTKSSYFPIAATIFAIGSIITTSYLIFVGFTVHENGTWSMYGSKAIDIQYHLGQSIRAAVLEKWDFQESNFAGEFISYPYYINLISGLLLKASLPLMLAFHIPTILLTCAWGLLLILTVREIGLSGLLAFTVVAGTLLGSGLGYIATIESGWFVTPLLRNVAVWPAQNIAYPSLMLGFLLWQRAFILGFPLFLLFILLLIRGIKTGERLQLLAAGIIGGLLPFAHMHSFIAASLVGISALIYIFYKKDGIFFKALRNLGYPMAILGLVQLFIITTGHVYPLEGTTSLRLGWMSDPAEVSGLVLATENTGRFLPWLRYMWTNFATLIFLPFIIIAALTKSENQNNILFSITGISACALWVLPNLIRLQAWDFDNNKIFSYAIMTSLISVAVYLNRNVHRKTFYSALYLILLLPSFLSPVVERIQANTFREPERIIILNQDEAVTAEWIRDNTEKNASFLSSIALTDRSLHLTHPAILASGRLTTSSFKILLFTHGIDSYDRREVIKAFFEEPAKNTEAIKTIPADYLIVDDSLRQQYPKLEKELERLKYPVVFTKDEIKILKLQIN